MNTLSIKQHGYLISLKYRVTIVMLLMPMIEYDRISTD